MNTNELITEVFTDIESGKFEKANAMLADDFRALLLGKEVNRPIYISALRSLRQGIPDLKLTIQHVKANGNTVTAKVKITGTNSHSIPALLKGWHRNSCNQQKSGRVSGRARNHAEKQQDRGNQKRKKYQGYVCKPAGKLQGWIIRNSRKTNTQIAVVKRLPFIREAFFNTSIQ